MTDVLVCGKPAANQACSTDGYCKVQAAPPPGAEAGPKP